MKRESFEREFSRSMCPITGRMVIIIYRAAESGENVVFFKRYSEPHSPYWRRQGLVRVAGETTDALGDIDGFSAVKLQAYLNTREGN